MQTQVELSEDGAHPTISDGGEFAPGIRRQRLQTVLGRKILRMIHVATDDACSSWWRLNFQKAKS